MTRFNSLPRNGLKVYELLHLLSDDIIQIKVVENDEVIFDGFIKDLIDLCEIPDGICDQEVAMIGENIDLYKGQKLTIYI